MTAKSNLPRRAHAERTGDVVSFGQEAPQDDKRPGRPKGSHDDPIMKILRQDSDPDLVLARTARIIIDFHHYMMHVRLEHKPALAMALEHMRKHHPGTFPRPITKHIIVDGQRVVVPEAPEGQELKREWREPNLDRAAEILRKNRFW